MSASASPAPSLFPAPGGSSTRHASTPLDKQRAQLEKLLKDPSKPAHVPAPPKEKSLRPAREMMKNVQGSSAGAGSGEFHVYKASRRREYERLKLMEDEAKKEAEIAEFELKKREREQVAEAKTAKNRAKRQKKKERVKGKGAEKEKEKDAGAGAGSGASGDQPFKKRRLVSGKEMVFRRPGEEGSEDEGDEDDVGPMPTATATALETSDALSVPIVDIPRITIIEDD